METISKVDYLKLAVEKRLPNKKAWVIDMFSITEMAEPMPNFISYRPDGSVCYINETGELVQITGAKIGKPLFTRDEMIELPAGFISTIKKPIITTIGCFLVNLCTFYYPFGDRVEYMNSFIPPKEIDKVWYDLVMNKNITVDELMASYAGTSQVSGYNWLFANSITERSLRPAPAAVKYLKKALVENKGKLHIPEVVADIQNEVVRLDKEWIAGDPEEGFNFIVKDKTYRVARMDTLYAQVLEEMPDAIITPALKDGLTIDKFVASVNKSMKGSIDRGNNTALGGVAVKEIVRLFEGTRIVMEDCGTNLWIDTLVNKTIVDNLVGRYVFSGKSTVLMDEAYIKGHVGKVLKLRDPRTCKSGKKDGEKLFCRYCSGEALAANPDAVTAQGISYGSVLLYIFMAAMHGKALEVVKLDLNEAFS